ncbi:FAD-binding oxidoreductase [Angustibacter peucedani]
MADAAEPGSTPRPDARGGPGSPTPTHRTAPRIPAQHVPRPLSPLDRRGLQALRDSVSGPVLVHGVDPPELLAQECAGFNLAVQHRPAVVVGAERTADVVAAVRFAAFEGLPVGVLATGHGDAWPFVDGVLVRTQRMDRVVVDPAHRTVRVAAGARWSQVVAAAAPYGLAPLSGSSSGVGVVGYTLGGGLGLLSRRHGFAADHVRRVELVTADGRLHAVDRLHEPDLFWALRGGKGSFGVVTALEVGLVAVPEFTAGAIVFPGEAADVVLHAWRAWATELPEEVTSSVALMRLPDAPTVPEPLRGVLSVHVRFALMGDQATADRLLEPLRRSARALVDDVRTRPYAEADEVHRDPAGPVPAWSGGVALVDLPAAGVDALLAVAGPRARTPLTVVEVRLMGGALAREPEGGNAVAARGAAYAVSLVGMVLPGQEDVAPTAAAAVVVALAPWHHAQRLTNWLGDLADRQRVCATWSMGQQARLRATKTLYDPDDMFSHGHSVLPSVSPADRAMGESDVLAGRYWDVERARWVPGPRARASGWRP